MGFLGTLKAKRVYVEGAREGGSQVGGTAVCKGLEAGTLTCQEDTRKSFVPLCVLTALLRCGSDTMQFTHLKYPNNGPYLLSWATITRTNFRTFVFAGAGDELRYFQNLSS